MDGSCVECSTRIASHPIHITKIQIILSGCRSDVRRASFQGEGGGRGGEVEEGKVNQKEMQDHAKDLKH